MIVLAAVRRIAVSVVLALLIGLISFSVMYFSPGNPAAMLLHYRNPTGGLNQQTVEAYAERLGTNQSFFAQFGDWLTGALKGDLGQSFKTGLPVLQEFTDRMWCTFGLMLYATVLALTVGVALGALSARYHNRLLDQIVRHLVVVNMSVPSFCLGLLFMWVFAIELKLFPSFGYDGAWSLILPGTVLGIGYSGTIVRMTKSSMMDNLGSPYVVTARAKGLTEGAILTRHVLKNVSLPIITLSGMNAVSLLGGSVIIENIFGLPGLGNYLITAIKMKDFPVIIGFVFLMGLMVIAINLLIDMLYALIDPRVRLAANEN